MRACAGAAQTSAAPTSSHAARPHMTPNLRALEHDVQCPLPEHVLAERAQLVDALDDRQEVVAGELADDAREHAAAVGEQQLGLADPAGIPQHLAGGGMAGGVLRRVIE